MGSSDEGVDANVTKDGRNTGKSGKIPFENFDPNDPNFKKPIVGKTPNKPPVSKSPLKKPAASTPPVVEPS